MAAEVVLKGIDLVRRHQGLPVASDVTRWVVTIWGSSHKVGVTLQHTAVEGVCATLEAGVDVGDNL